MLAQAFPTSTIWITSLAILSASLAGSVHCMAMCGGLTGLAAGESKSSLLTYHFARLVGYLSLGLLAGFLGKALISEEFSTILSSFSTLLIAITLIWSGWSLFQNRSFHMLGALARLARRFMPFALKFEGKSRAALVGLFSVFLPCGWLYTFVAAAAATQNVFSGGVVLVAFWLGTLPALLLGGFSLNWVFARLQGKMRSAVALFLIILGIVTVHNKTKTKFVYAAQAESAVAHSSCHNRP